MTQKKALKMRQKESLIDAFIGIKLTRLAIEIKQNCYQCYKNPQSLNVSSTLLGDWYWWNVHMEYFNVFHTHKKKHAEKIEIH